MIWYIVLTIVMSNGDVLTDIHYPNDPKYNNEQSCNEAGQSIADQKQIEIGTNSGRAYYICKAITLEEISKAVGKSGSNS